MISLLYIYSSIFLSYHPLAINKKLSLHGIEYGYDQTYGEGLISWLEKKFIEDN